MPVPSVTLSGSALTGIGPARMAAGVAPLPTTVKLGCILGAAQPPVPAFGAYLDTAAQSAPPPESTKWRESAGEALSQMYMNDTYGCCVISGKAHNLGVWSANDSDSDGTIIAQDDEITQQYFKVCGPGDNGCVVTHVLDYMRDYGFLASGYHYFIDGYVAVDWTNKTQVQTVIALFGATTIAVNLPQEWTQSDVWDVTRSQIVGGHDVSWVDYGPEGLYVSSWGRVYLMTWRAALARTWIRECYAILAPSWYNYDQLAPSGVDVKTLQRDMLLLQRGRTPPIPAGEASTPPGVEVASVATTSGLAGQIDAIFTALQERYASNPVFLRILSTAQGIVDTYLNLYPPALDVTLKTVVDQAFGWAISQQRNQYVKYALGVAQALVDGYLSGQTV